MNNGSTLFRMIRSLTAQVNEHDSQHGRMAMVVEAVHNAKARGEVTINDVADELGIDQSGASRLVSQAITAGLIKREKSALDGRSRQCSITPAGEQLLAAARKWQEDVYNRLTTDWSSTEKTQFANAMERIIIAAKSDLP